MAAAPYYNILISKITDKCQGFLLVKQKKSELGKICNKFAIFLFNQQETVFFIVLRQGFLEFIF